MPNQEKPIRSGLNLTTEIAIDTDNLQIRKAFLDKYLNNFEYFQEIRAGIPINTKDVGFVELQGSLKFDYRTFTINIERSVIDKIIAKSGDLFSDVVYTIDFKFDLPLKPFVDEALGEVEFRGFLFDGDDSITGSKFDDKLNAYDGRDDIAGMAGNDRLVGGNGQDLINGGDDADVLFGRDGADLFVYRSFRDSTAKSQDVISDFHRIESDRIDVSKILPEQRFVFIGKQTFAEYRDEHPGARFMLRYDPGEELVEAKNPGDRPNLSISVVDMPFRLTADDFVL